MKTHTPARHTAAFSLVELLVVVAILGIMAAAGSVALTGTSNSLQGAASAASSLFGMARTEAILRKAPARLIVETDYNAGRPENYRRRLAVVVSTNGGATWDQVGRWTTLPGNAFFNSDLSRTHGQMTIPGLPGVAGAPSFEYYEFAATGQAAARGQFVLSAGSAQGGNFVETAPDARAGFYLHKMGRQTFFKDASEIPAP